MGLPEDPKRPLIGIVSRFASQKGFDIFAEAAAGLAQQDVSFAVLGSGEAWCEDAFRYFQATYPDKFAVRIGYDDGLAHRIEAGADMFLMPSKYEPCGLNQIYSLRYGTVPIVRATGGLADTVNEETGFLFHGYSAGALSAAVLRALDAYKDKKAWTVRRRAGMAKDFSWDASARRYREMYHRLIG